MTNKDSLQGMLTAAGAAPVDPILPGRTYVVRALDDLEKVMATQAYKDLTIELASGLIDKKEYRKKFKELFVSTIED